MTAVTLLCGKDMSVVIHRLLSKNHFFQAINKTCEKVSLDD